MIWYIKVRHFQHFLLCCFLFMPTTNTPPKPFSLTQLNLCTCFGRDANNFVFIAKNMSVISRGVQFDRNTFLFLCWILVWNLVELGWNYFSISLFSTTHPVNDLFRYPAKVIAINWKFDWNIGPSIMAQVWLNHNGDFVWGGGSVFIPFSLFLVGHSIVHCHSQIQTIIVMKRVLH